MMVDKKDLIEGDFYVMSSHKDFKGSSWLIRYKYEEMYLGGGKNFNRGPHEHDFEYYKKATPQQENHIKACIEAGRFISESEIILIDNYEIY